MKLRLFAAIVVAFLTTSIAAHAQTAGIYLNPIGTRISNSFADSGTFAFLGQNSKSQMFYGVSMGGYYNFYNQGKLQAGIDVRDSIQRGNNASINQFLVGARVSGSPFKLPFKPYAQIAVGAGTTRAPTNPRRANKAVTSFTGGVDYTLNHRFDWRVIEVSYGSLSTISTSSLGSGPTIPASHLLGFSTGFVIKFP